MQDRIRKYRGVCGGLCHAQQIDQNVFVRVMKARWILASPAMDDPIQNRDTREVRDIGIRIFDQLEEERRKRFKIFGFAFRDGGVFGHRAPVAAADVSGYQKHEYPAPNVSHPLLNEIRLKWLNILAAIVGIAFSLRSRGVARGELTEELQQSGVHGASVDAPRACDATAATAADFHRK